MNIRVKLFGTLRRLSIPGKPGYWEGEVPEGSTVKEILHLLGAGEYEANAVAINGEPASFEDILPPGAEVILVTPMGGGD